MSTARLAWLALALATTTAAAADKEARISCRMDHARYELVEREGDRANAVLSFKPTDTLSSLGGTMVTPSGDVFDFVTSYSNGYVTPYATIQITPEVEATSTILGYTSDMVRANVRADEPAPAFVILPDAGSEAERVQRGQDKTIEVPDGVWRFVVCSK